MFPILFLNVCFVHSFLRHASKYFTYTKSALRDIEKNDFQPFKSDVYQSGSVFPSKTEPFCAGFESHRGRISARLLLPLVICYPAEAKTLVLDSAIVHITFNDHKGIEIIRENIDHFDKALKKTLLNYEYKRNYSIDKSSSRKRVSHSGFGDNRQWWKFPVKNTDVYKLTYSSLVENGIINGQIPSNDIRLYGRFFMLSTAITSEENEIPELSVIMNDGGDGIFNQSDELIFFASGAEGSYLKDSDLPVFSPYINYFDTLTITGLLLVKQRVPLRDLF